MQILLDSQSAQQVRRVTLRVPSVHSGKLFFQFGGPNPIFIREIFLHVDRIFLLHHFPQRGVSLQHGVQNGTLVESKVVLFQYRQPFSRSEHHGSPRWLQIATQYSQERRFPGTIGTYYSITISRCKFQIHIPEQSSLPKLNL